MAIGYGDGRHGEFADYLKHVYKLFITDFKGHVAVAVLMAITMRGQTN